MRNIWFVLSFLWLGVLWIVNVNGDFPLNDDWQYAYAVKTLVEDGVLDYRGQFSPIVLVQVLWGALFCKTIAGVFNFTILRWSTLVLVPLILAIVLKIGRFLSLSKKALIILGLSTCFTPLVMVLAPSFMSDVPFALLAIAAVLSYWVFSQNKQQIWLIVALILSTLAFYIRQPGMVLPVVFGIHYWWVNGRKNKHISLAILLTFFAISLLFSWEYGVKPVLGLEDNFKSDMSSYLQLMQNNPIAFFKSLVLRLLKSCTYLGLFSLPLAPFIWPKKMPWKWLVTISLSSVLMVVAAHLADKPFPFGGNVFYNFGLGPELLMDVYTLGLNSTHFLAQWMMDLLHFLSISWAFILMYLCWNKWPLMNKNQRSYLQLWLLLSAMYFPLMSITSYYDRYVLLPLILFWPLLLSLMEKRKTKKNIQNTKDGYSFQKNVSIKGPRRKTSMCFKYLPLVLFIVFSIAATHDYLAWNRATFKSFNWLQKQDVSIQQVDAGYGLNGWYNYGAPRILNDSTSFWWVTNDQYLITFGKLSNRETIHKTAYKRWLWLKNDYIYILK